MIAKLHYFLPAWGLVFGLWAVPAVAVGAEAPAKPVAAESMPSSDPIFAAVLADFDGQPVALAELKGKVVVLNFWATWCTPCRTEIPHLEEGHRKYGPRGVMFIGAAIEDNADSVRDFVKAYGITYPVAMAGKDKGITLLQAINNKIAGLPYTVVLDRQGNVVAAKRGILTPARLQQILDPLL
jgi:thiol-disulfide isomerase/thioredoxin